MSVGTLFAAGILPGILIAVAMCSVNYHVSKKRNYKGDGQTPPLREILVTTEGDPRDPAAGGDPRQRARRRWFTPTEASVVAVFYALVCGKFVYRTLEWKMPPDILSRSALLLGLGADHHRPVGLLRLGADHRGHPAGRWPSG